jgi:hypothetical protein
VEAQARVNTKDTKGTKGTKGTKVRLGMRLVFLVFSVLVVSFVPGGAPAFAQT